MKKVIYIDVETTGLDPLVHGLIQVAAIVVVDGKKIDEIEFKVDPHSYKRGACEISQEAMGINGKTVEEISTYPASNRSYTRFLRFLDKHINKYNKQDKPEVAGYNTRFDMAFIQEWFEDNNNDYCWSYFKGDLDVLALVRHLVFCGLIDTENHQLPTMCKEFKIKLDAHDALSDIKATRKLHKKLIKRFINVKK